MHSIRKTSRKILGFGKILKCAFDGHFTIPLGHRRGFMNGHEIGHMTETTSELLHLNFIHNTHIHTM